MACFFAGDTDGFCSAHLQGALLSSPAGTYAQPSIVNEMDASRKRRFFLVMRVFCAF
jgi:hypothetical protein